MILIVRGESNLSIHKISQAPRFYAYKMLDNIQSSDKISLVICLVLAVQGGVFAKVLIHERPTMTFPPRFLRFKVCLKAHSQV